MGKTETNETPGRGRPPKGWRAVFLKALANHGNLRAACEKAGVNRSTAFRHRDKDPAFAAAWESAIEDSVDLLELEARRRAAKGVDEPVFYKGVQVATVKKYSDGLLTLLLKAHRPDKFREGRVDGRAVPDAPYQPEVVPEDDRTPKSLQDTQEGSAT